jgi:hypothetical protein
MCKTRNFEFACAALGAPFAGAAADPVAEAEAASSPSCENTKKIGMNRSDDNIVFSTFLIVGKVAVELTEIIKKCVSHKLFLKRCLNFLKLLFN